MTAVMLINTTLTFNTPAEQCPIHYECCFPLPVTSDDTHWWELLNVWFFPAVRNVCIEKFGTPRNLSKIDISHDWAFHKKNSCLRGLVNHDGTWSFETKSNDVTKREFELMIFYGFGTNVVGDGIIDADPVQTWNGKLAKKAA